LTKLVPNLNHHYQAYGGWSFALDDYEQMGIMGYLNSPQFLEMGAIIDPFSYLARLTMPLYIICATGIFKNNILSDFKGDEFFLPDSPQFFINSLQGEHHLRMVPNAEHSMAGHGYDVISSIGNFFYSVLTNEVRPKYSYNMVYSNDTASISGKFHSHIHLIS
jgi:PhoPQ-activated pathogenicity-related protein